LYQAVACNVMISSPSDVTAERDAFSRAVGKWNVLHSKSKDLVLLPIGWDTHSYPVTGKPPQQAINEQVVEQADILVAVFRNRLGTPTEEHPSGTVEEIEEMLKAERPVLVYFSQEDVPRDSIGDEQLQKLREYRDDFRSRRLGLYGEFESAEKFEEKLYNDLVHLVNDNLSDLMPDIHIDCDLPGESYLPDEAKMLLKTAASENGRIVRHRHLGGTMFGAGKSWSSDVQQPRAIATWNNAIETLLLHGFISERGSKGEIYSVTSSGYEHADELGDKWLLKREQ